MMRFFPNFNPHTSQAIFANRSLSRFEMFVPSHQPGTISVVYVSNSGLPDKLPNASSRYDFACAQGLVSRNDPRSLSRAWPGFEARKSALIWRLAPCTSDEGIQRKAFRDPRGFVVSGECSTLRNGTAGSAGNERAVAALGARKNASAICSSVGLNPIKLTTFSAIRSMSNSSGSRY